MFILALLPLALKSSDKWPDLTARQAQTTVFAVSRLSVPAYLVRNGRMTVILPFDGRERIASHKNPPYLAILDGDQFWLKKKGAAIVHAVNDKGIKERSTRQTWTAKRTTHYKDYDRLTAEELRVLRPLLCVGQNSKPILDVSEPGLVLPLPGEPVVCEIPYCFWTANKRSAVKMEVVYVLSEGEIPLGGDVPKAGVSGLPISRHSVERRLVDHFGAGASWTGKPIPIRFRMTDRANEVYEVDVDLVPEEEAKNIQARMARLRAVLAERDGRLVSLVKATMDLSVAPSMAIRALRVHLRQRPDDGEARAALCWLAEDRLLSPSLLGLK